MFLMFLVCYSLTEMDYDMIFYIWPSVSMGMELNVVLYFYVPRIAANVRSFSLSLSLDKINCLCAYEHNKTSVMCPGQY